MDGLTIFSTFFYGEKVYFGEKEYPLGQVSVDILNLDERVPTEIELRTKALQPALEAFMKQPTETAAATAQEKMNAVWDLVFTLPLYRDLGIDREGCYNIFSMLLAEPKNLRDVLTPHSEAHSQFVQVLDLLKEIVQDVRFFQNKVTMMLRMYFEPLKRHNAKFYARAYTYFASDMLCVRQMLTGEAILEESFPLEVEFVPMEHPTEKGEVFLAEKAYFTRLQYFLFTEFYRGLMIGNAPRKCRNCGRYFLLTSGYNTCYCNNIAPGETKRTCRKVGAHRKEAQGKLNRSPAQQEYDRTYNRLKARKQRGKISADEWNAAVAQAQKLLEQSDRGELTDGELKARLEAL
jgi:hypothetical protein